MKKLISLIAVLMLLIFVSCPAPGENGAGAPAEEDAGKPVLPEKEEGTGSGNGEEAGETLKPAGKMVSMSADLSLWTMDCTFYAFAEEPEGDPFGFGAWCISDEDPRVFIYKQFGKPQWAETMITYISSWEDVPVTVVWENGVVEENSSSAELVLVDRGTEPGTWVEADLSELGKTHDSDQCRPAIKFEGGYWPMMACYVYAENGIARHEGRKRVDYRFDTDGKLLDLTIGVTPPSGGSWQKGEIMKNGTRKELYTDFSYDAEYTDGTVIRNIDLRHIVREGKTLRTITCNPVKGGSVGESFTVKYPRHEADTVPFVSP